MYEDPTQDVVQPTTSGSLAYVDLAVDGLGAYLNYRSNKKQMELSEEQQKSAQSHALKMWQMQADWNSPQAQMARLQAAGLNPNMLYGTGAAGATGSMANKPETYIQGTQVPNPMENVLLPEALKIIRKVFEIRRLEKEDNILFHQERQEADAAQISYTERSERVMRYYSRLEDMEKLYNSWAEELNADISESRRRQIEEQMAKTELELAKDLRELGLTNADPTWLRMLIKILPYLGIKIFDFEANPPEIKDEVRKQVNDNNTINVEPKF